MTVLLQALPSGEDDEDDSDSDSDDDDVKVTIGNIKTGAPSYMWVQLGVGVWGWAGKGMSWELLWFLGAVATTPQWV